MKIAMVSEHASPLAVLGGVDAGGQNVHVDALATGLTRQGHDVVVFTRRDSVGLPSRVRTPGGYVVEHVPAGPATEVPKDEIWSVMPEFSRYLERRWCEERVDVVHAHFWMSGAAAVSAARVADIPVVQTFHALGSVKQRHQGARDSSPSERIAVEAELCRSVDHVIATCRDEIAELRAIGLDPSRASIIPCGVDLEHFRPLPAPVGDRHRLLAVGRLVERKGVAEVIHAVAKLPDTELVVCGGPTPAEVLALDPEAVRLRLLADDLGCADRVRLTGGMPRERMPAVFAAADLVVATPWYEPFGIVPLEAMACGRPIIGSAVGGLLDSIEDGVTGELVPPREPDALATAIESLLADPERRQRYGAAGVERARSHFGWDAVVARTEKVLTTVVGRHTSSTMEVSS